MTPPSRTLVLAACTALALGGCASQASSTPQVPAPVPSTPPATTPTVAHAASTPHPVPTLPTGIRSIVALGDSVPAGSGSDATPFPDLVRAALAPTNPGVDVTNLGNDGTTAADLADALRKDKDTRSAVVAADVVLVTTGANDLYPALASHDAIGCTAPCEQEAVDAAARDVRDALTTVRALARPGARVLLTDYWNVFADGDAARADVGQATLGWSDDLTRRANTAFCAAATATGVTCVDTYAPFKADGSKDPTSLLAADGDHPNQAGHQVIADAVLAALRTPEQTHP